ncbi:MAG TPA: hypothetical protein VHS31_04830 [Tepidisphaeraceae bacterium]|jgi:hypothetical protein|nr:hypothetical protein [Tepidisphaeraceae bacterium]
MARKRLKLVVLGMMARCPYGGQTWLYLNWLRALAAHGHEVWYVEDDPIWPYDPMQNTVTDDARYARKHLADSMARVGLADQWAYRIHGLNGACWGLEPKQLDELYASCDALLNIVGATDLREEQMKAPLRVYVETDPVTAELRLANGDEHTREAFAAHHHIVTYGENYGAPDCGVPLCGLTFKTTRQPIDLELWPMHFDPSAKFFTTIGNYRQSGSDVEYKSVTYKWSKHHEWEKFLDLPKRTPQPFEVALNFSSEEEKKRIESFGWRTCSPFQMSLDIFGAYPEYFRKSRGQFGVAKDQNIRLRSGWSSERDICYLACGKPVITQDTGFSNIIPCGEGLFGISTIEQAVDAIERINKDYEHHCKSARKIAEDYFAAPMLGKKLLEDVGLA